MGLPNFLGYCYTVGVGTGVSTFALTGKSASTTRVTAMNAHAAPAILAALSAKFLASSLVKRFSLTGWSFSMCSPLDRVSYLSMCKSCETNLKRIASASSLPRRGHLLAGTRRHPLGLLILIGRSVALSAILLIIVLVNRARKKPKPLLGA